MGAALAKIAPMKTMDVIAMKDAMLAKTAVETY